MNIQTVNIKQDMPTVETARMRLDQALRTAKSRRVKALRIVHGYGSTGPGGAIKRDVLQQLARKQRAGQIKAYAAGEDFSPFHPSARKIIDAIPELARDPDYSRSNPGITIVLL